MEHELLETATPERFVLESSSFGFFTMLSGPGQLPTDSCFTPPCFLPFDMAIFKDESWSQSVLLPCHDLHRHDCQSVCRGEGRCTQAP